jgi:hypothetical protein
MNTTDGKNVVASVLARLRNTSKSNDAPFQQVLQQYASERFLYRISKSRHAKSVILKGALLLKTIGIPTARPTLDIDMLRTGKADEGTLVALIKDCASLDVEPDGLAFLANSVVAEEITKDSEYQGTRILMDARMDNVRLRIQVDFGVGDVIVPGPRMIQYPVLLGGDTIELLAYPVETSIAEKLQAMVALGDTNSRMKDFYDVWICASHLDFETGKLLKAVQATFANRETNIPTDDFEVLTTGFAERHLVQWNAFVKKMGERALANRFGEVIEDLRKFAIPMFRCIALSEKIGKQWMAGDGWLAD